MSFDLCQLVQVGLILCRLNESDSEYHVVSKQELYTIFNNECVVTAMNEYPKLGILAY